MRCYDSRHTVAVLRKIIGLSQGELATLAGCSKRTVQAIEIGRLKLSENLATKIAHETGVTSDWLLEGNHSTPPKMALTDAPYTKKVYEDTRAAITAGMNPDPVTINLSHEGSGFLNAAPMPMMAKLVEQLSSLLHPQIDYWLASVLSSIFAATKSGQASLAINRLFKFSEAMKKAFGQRFDDEFTNDAAVVFEQCLQRIKMAERVLQKDEPSGSSLPPKPSVSKNKSAQNDLLADMLLGTELQDSDMEALWTDLNEVGARLKARQAAARKIYEAFDDQLMAVFRTAKSGSRKPGPATASKPPRNK